MFTFEFSQKKPNGLLYYSEMPRAFFEWSMMQVARPLLHMAPAPDRGKPVIVLPGFTGGDRTTAALRHYLSALGYDTSGWQHGINWGIRKDLFDGALRWMDTVHSQTNEKVALIGQSLGGLYAREMAKVAPETVSQVITLGSPFNDSNGVSSRVSHVYSAFNSDHLDKDEQLRLMNWDLPIPPPVPTTSIYSRTDGVVHWNSCTQAGDYDNASNIEVFSSHTGMAFNPQVLALIAELLKRG